MEIGGGSATEKRARPGRSWSDAGAWEGGGLRREVFFFGSADVPLYGSLYAAPQSLRPFGILACASWGVEADRCEPLVRATALAMAKLGGAGMVFHYPGHGDSYGDLVGLDMARLCETAADALAEARRRCPGLAWGLAGFAFGASVAALAAPGAGVESLLLLQPDLRPGAYMRRLQSSRRPLAPGPAPREMMEVNSTAGMAYGYPVPHRIAAQTDAEDSAPLAALEEFQGRGTVIRHLAPPPDDPLRGFEAVDVPGSWRFGAQNHPRLASATTDWLDRHTQDSGA